MNKILNRVYLVIIFIISTTPAWAESDPAEILAADTAFAALSQQGVVDAFDHYLADNAVKLNPGQPPVIGRAAIIAGMRATWPAGASLDWKPEGGTLADSRDVGYTWGFWKYTMTSEDGTPKVAQGKYLTVWQKNAAGEWRAIADMGN